MEGGKTETREEREAQEGGDICIIMADLHCCMTETYAACKN